jgi:hypothetical protein
MKRTTETFRRQHDELVRLAGVLVELVARDPMPASEVQRTLSKLAGVLRVHAAMEDEALYPRLLRHDDPELRALARDFLDRFGSAYRGFLDFRAQWSSIEQIAAAPADLARGARAVAELLGRRIAEENTVLYERVDALFPLG